MKTMVFATTAILLLGWATGADAGSGTVRHGRNAVAEYDGDGVPHILNDRPWVKTCAGDQSHCDATSGTKPDGQRS